MWMPDRHAIGRPVYAGIARAIGEAVDQGLIKRGDRLASQREFAYQLDVTLATVNKAFKIAERQGLIVSQVGRGSFVGDFPENTESGDYGPKNTIDLRYNGSLVEPVNDVMTRVLGAIARRRSLFSLLEFHPAFGPQSHRLAFSEWLSPRVPDVPIENLLVAEDGRDAMISILTSLRRRGQRFIMAELSVEDIGSVLNFHDLRPVTVPIGPNGMDPADISEAANKHDIGAIWLVPTMHDPTNFTMPTNQRRKIVELSRKIGCVIIEDDSAGMLANDLNPTIASLAPDITIYCAGIMKSLTPGLGFCTVAMPGPLQEHFEDAIMAMAWRSPMLASEIVSTMINDGHAHRMLRSHRAISMERLAIARDIFGEVDFIPDQPTNHLWLKVSEDRKATDVAKKLEDQGILVLPGESFMVTGARNPQAIRVSLTGVRDTGLLRDALMCVGRQAGLLRKD
jgi:DNA-binding transcriptional MocR family regulator